MAVFVKDEEKEESQEVSWYEWKPEEESVLGRQLPRQVNVQGEKEQETSQQLKTKKPKGQTWKLMYSDSRNGATPLPLTGGQRLKHRGAPVGAVAKNT